MKRPTSPAEAGSLIGHVIAYAILATALALVVIVCVWLVRVVAGALL